MTYLSVTNFWKFQNADVWKKSKTHPPWFKHYVHRDRELDKLPMEARLLFWEILACATRYSNVLEADLNWLYAETRVEPEVIAEQLPKLVSGGWLSQTRSRRRSRNFRESIATTVENYKDVDIDKEPPKPPNGLHACTVGGCGLNFTSRHDLRDHLEADHRVSLLNAKGTA